MALFLSILSWISTGLHVLLATFAIATALYYLAELVEEYTSYTAKVLNYIITTTIAFYILLYFCEDFPTSVILCGVFAQVMHLSIMRTFPFFYFTSLPFLLSIFLFLVNHYLAFSHFSSNFYTLHEILAYFTLFIWLVPLVFFVSLSANENVLPTRAETTPLLSSNNREDFVTGYFNKKGKRYGLLTVFGYLKEAFFPSASKKSF